MKQSSSLFLFFFCVIVNCFLFSNSSDNVSKPETSETLQSTWFDSLNPINHFNDYRHHHAEKYVSEKPSWIQMPCCKHGRYLQLNLDPCILVCATTVKILYQTFNTMARTGTKFENMKVSVLRPGVAGTISKWGPFFTTYFTLYLWQENRKFKHPEKKSE